MADSDVDRLRTDATSRVPERAEGAGDPRIAAVLEVLQGNDPRGVATRWAVEPALLERWVTAFVEAGTAQVTNRPLGQTARQRDRFLSTFMYGLRTPLAMAQGWVGLLRDGADPASNAEAIQRLTEALVLLDERALDVELLTAAMLGRLSLSLSAVPVSLLTDSMTEDVGGEGGDVELTVDPPLFARVLRDLWAAAAETEPPPRSVGLEVETIAPWVELRILREGEPIDPVDIQRLFEPFDVDDDTVRVTVGLYLARALTVVHGGTLGVEQDDLRTTFWVRVPDARRPGG